MKRNLLLIEMFLVKMKIKLINIHNIFLTEAFWQVGNKIRK